MSIKRIISRNRHLRTYYENITSLHEAPISENNPIIYLHLTMIDGETIDRAQSSGTYKVLYYLVIGSFGILKVLKVL